LGRKRLATVPTPDLKRCQMCQVCTNSDHSVLTPGIKSSDLQGCSSPVWALPQKVLQMSIFFEFD
jgi:hypothetical protein